MLLPFSVDDDGDGVRESPAIYTLTQRSAA